MLRQQILIIAPGQQRQGFTQRNQLLIGIKHRIRVRQRRLDVDLGSYRQRNPRLTVAKATVLAGVPLHRRAAVVARFAGQDRQQFVRALPLRRTFDKHIVAFDVAIIGDAAEVRIGHADLFALIDIGRALHAVQHHRQHFRRRHPVLAFVAKARHDARLIVVTPEQRVPRPIVHPCCQWRNSAFSAT
jgi:hypothetical protein